MANEKRLIDADALLAELDKFANPMPNKSGYDFLCGVASVITEIEDAPTVNAVEVVHGRWRMETDEEEPHPMFKLPVCCVCGKTGGMTNYCPNCGADMRERSDGK